MEAGLEGTIGATPGGAPPFFEKGFEQCLQPHETQPFPLLKQGHRFPTFRN
jgi:hypothetical protein